MTMEYYEEHPETMILLADYLVLAKLLLSYVLQLQLPYSEVEPAFLMALRIK